MNPASMMILRFWHFIPICRFQKGAMTLTTTGDPPENILRGRILSAALTELAAVKRVEEFDLDGVADRAGVTVLTVKQFWANTPALFTATLMEWGDQNIPIPNTGSLRDDLLEYSLSYAKATNTPVGRLLLRMVVISPGDWDTYESKKNFRQARPDRMTVMIRLAIDRGECAADTDAALVVELLAAALCTPLLFNGTEITDEFCTQVVDLFLHGIQS